MSMIKTAMLPAAFMFATMSFAADEAKPNEQAVVYNDGAILRFSMPPQQNGRVVKVEVDLTEWGVVGPVVISNEEYGNN
jgi:hypothetical protein